MLSLNDCAWRAVSKLWAYRRIDRSRLAKAVCTKRARGKGMVCGGEKEEVSCVHEDKTHACNASYIII